MKKNNINYESEYYKLLAKYLNLLNYNRYLKKSYITILNFIDDRKIREEFDRYVQNITYKST